MAEFAHACGLGADGDGPRTLAMNLIATIRRLNERIGIPSTIEQIADADVPQIVQRALAEAHGTYPVPTYMSADDCPTVVRRAAGRNMAAATNHRAPAVGSGPEKDEV